MKTKKLNKLLEDKIPFDKDVFITSNNIGYWLETQWIKIEKCNQLAKSLGKLVYKIERRGNGIGGKDTWKVLYNL